MLYRPLPPQCAHWGTFPKGEGIDRQKFSNQVIITWHFSECKAVFAEKGAALRLLWFYPWKSPVMALTVT